jgi:16S rRNA (cytosine967-C5)-methyltransferase
LRNLTSTILQDPTRHGAWLLLRAVLGRRETLDAALDALPAMDARDRAAAHRLAASCLRHAGTLESVLEPHVRKAPPAGVKYCLYIGAAGLLFLDAPAHAAVGTAVALARAAGFPAFAGLVNAVLRRVAEGGVAVLDELDMPRLDTPAWAWASWGANARAIATAHAQEAPLDISAKPGIEMPGEPLPTGTWRLPAGTPVTELPGFAAGDFWVQDMAAALPARLLDVQPGEAVLDLCAAPGGKTAQLAAAGAVVTAVERDPSRLAVLRENLARLRLDVTSVQADAFTWRPDQKYGAILLDAPCSATGTIRRHPDLLHIRRPADIAALAAGQDRLLDAAASMLAPGGRLIYAVCSLQPEEGAARVEAAIRRLGLTRAPLTLPELPGAVTEAGDIVTHPALPPGMDGFFIARLVR